jgi:hypothetical protein
VFYLCAWRDDGHLDVSISNDDFYIHHLKRTGYHGSIARPLNPLQVILKVFPYIFLSINATVIVVLGVFVFGMPIEGSLFLLAFEHTFHYNGSFIGNIDLNYF